MWFYFSENFEIENDTKLSKTWFFSKKMIIINLLCTIFLFTQDDV